MKNYYLIALIYILAISCSKDDSNLSDSSFKSKKEMEVFKFQSKDEMYKEIDDILLVKEQKQQKILSEFNTRNNAKILLNKSVVKIDEQSKNRAILEDLKAYNIAKLNAIYELRRELNFTSIQSIAEEINSLEVVNSSKAKELYTKYNAFLKKDEFLVETVYDYRIANVLNCNGVVLINASKLDLNKENTTGKYIGLEAIVYGKVVESGNFYVGYQAAREVHENDLGVKYFKYYCRLMATYKVYRPAPGHGYYLVPCPTTYTVDSGSVAGFVQSGDNPFGAYAFSYDYPSGYGEYVINIGGNKNVAYVPAGGKVSGTFSTNTGGFYQEMTGSVTYQEN